MRGGWGIGRRKQEKHDSERMGDIGCRGVHVKACFEAGIICVDCPVRPSSMVGEAVRGEMCLPRQARQIRPLVVDRLLAWFFEQPWARFRRQNSCKWAATCCGNWFAK